MRYLLFGGIHYYAQGGANDFLGKSKDVEELKSKAISLMNVEGPNADWRLNNIEWWHIYDTQKDKIVCGTKSQAHGNVDIDKSISVG